MNGVIKQIHDDHQNLANVLKDHSGIRRIVEDDLYPDTAHFIYELLQNAEDAQASDATFILSGSALIFEHDGRPFNEHDIRGITDIGEGTKSKDDNQIGRFGIGFKVVFSFTETPRIWSPTFAFEIYDMVLPKELPMDSMLGKRTRFEFKFNSEKKRPDAAFSEINKGFEEISDKTLLFLSNIEKIKWKIEDGQEVHLQRITHYDNHIEILRKIDGFTKSTHFLCFTEPVVGFSRQYIAIAFQLEQLECNRQTNLSASFSEKFRIVPADQGSVAVYFTATKETSNLHFHIHAPFVPDLSRSSIKNTPANEPLFQQLAQLAAQSLNTIRDLNLFDREFLEVLPNPEDEIYDRYLCFRETIYEAMNNHPLTPLHSGGYAPAKQLVQAKASLKSLLDKEDLKFLTDYEYDHCEWAIGVNQKNSRIDRLLSALDIREWDIEQFVNVLENKLRDREYSGYWSWPLNDLKPNGDTLRWLSSKPIKWHREFYALLYNEFQDSLSRFKDLCIIRLSDNKYKKGSECYFPPSGTYDALSLPFVAKETYQSSGKTTKQEEVAKKFLEEIGVKEVGEYEQVEAILEQRYVQPSSSLSWKTYESDLMRFIALSEKDKRFKNLIKDKKYRIFQNTDHKWCWPSDIYLDAPYLETRLFSYYEPLAGLATLKPLAGRYKAFKEKEKLIEFAILCGVADKLKICETDCGKNPNFEYLHSAPGSIETCTKVDRDYVIPELQKLFENPNLSLSQLIWSTLSDNSNNQYFLRAQYRRNQSNKMHDADSQLVYQLRDIAWIPQKNGEFVRPESASRDQLPSEGFSFEPGSPWVIAIGFGNSVNEHLDALKKLGIPENVKLTEVQQFANLSPSNRQQILAQYNDSSDLPKHTPTNPERRKETVLDKAKNAPKRTTDKRQRLISVGRDTNKREKTIPYIRELYTNNDDVHICQICKGSLPFKMGNGKYFFEAVEFLCGLERLHYQNYLGLCPNHAAMFMYANDASPEEMQEKFLEMDGHELELTLADQQITIYFTDTQIKDLMVVIEVNEQDKSE